MSGNFPLTTTMNVYPESNKKLYFPPNIINNVLNGDQTQDPKEKAQISQQRHLPLAFLLAACLDLAALRTTCYICNYGSSLDLC
ncbi:hypothetical protein DSO57_1028359 [Entomophthora muscae]|uniref:Uncharacterized protein n=1 Tax=Entomophthora muscae TaxID=34485 RepID=A0ACC2RG85_9FUNG|nr:hypothetical protein DSO57_1028359 [Entomophthora muscae]